MTICDAGLGLARGFALHHEASSYCGFDLDESALAMMCKEGRRLGRHLADHVLQCRDCGERERPALTARPEVWP